MGRYSSTLKPHTVMKWLVLSALLVGSCVADEEITDEDLKDIHKVTGLDKEKSFRCGLFFPDPKSPDIFALEPKPIAPLFIFNATWEAEECENGEDGIERFKSFCESIWKKIQRKLALKLSTPSLRKKADKDVTIGDDICTHLKEKVKAPFVGVRFGAKNELPKKFPDGLEWGMYANGCNAPEWHYAGIKHEEKVCCGGKPKDKRRHRPCDSP